MKRAMIDAAAGNPLDHALRTVARQVGLLGAVTAKNAARERARLLAAYSAGDSATPDWEYDPTEVGALRRVLDVIQNELDAGGAAASPVGALYMARCDELALELALVESVGGPDFGRLSAARFPAASPEADALAAAFTDPRGPHGQALADDENGECWSDSDDPDSLISRVRRLVGHLRLPVRVEARDGMASLAATGDGIVVVAAHRRLSHRAAERTALHEVHGHVLPRVRAARQSLSIFSIGTARGIDEQEGLALLLEERAGYLRGARARELGARHSCVMAMRSGASFVEAMKLLREDLGLDLEMALRVAERAYRGGDGVHAGLGREVVYLPAFIGVRTHLRERPADEAILASGQVSLDALDVLREHARPC